MGVTAESWEDSSRFILQANVLALAYRLGSYKWPPHWRNRPLLVFIRNLGKEIISAVLFESSDGICQYLDAGNYGVFRNLSACNLVPASEEPKKHAPTTVHLYCHSLLLKRVYSGSSQVSLLKACSVSDNEAALTEGQSSPTDGEVVAYLWQA